MPLDHHVPVVRQHDLIRVVFRPPPLLRGQITGRLRRADLRLRDPLRVLHALQGLRVRQRPGLPRLPALQPKAPGLSAQICPLLQGDRLPQLVLPPHPQDLPWPPALPVQGLQLGERGVIHGPRGVIIGRPRVQLLLPDQVPHDAPCAAGQQAFRLPAPFLPEPHPRRRKILFPVLQVDLQLRVFAGGALRGLPDPLRAYDLRDVLHHVLEAPALMRLVQPVDAPEAAPVEGDPPERFFLRHHGLVGMKAEVPRPRAVEVFDRLPAYQRQPVLFSLDRDAVQGHWEGGLPGVFRPAPQMPCLDLRAALRAMAALPVRDLFGLALLPEPDAPGPAVSAHSAADPVRPERFPAGGAAAPGRLAADLRHGVRQPVAFEKQGVFRPGPFLRPFPEPVRRDPRHIPGVVPHPLRRNLQG